MEKNKSVVIAIKDAMIFIDSLTFTGHDAANRVCSLYSELECAEKLLEKNTDMEENEKSE